MKIDVPYGKDGQMSAEISDDIAVSFLEANDVEIRDEAEILKQAIENPINSKGFAEFLGDAKKVLVIVNDATRPTPTHRVLDVLFDDLKKTDFNFIIATGAHRAPSEEEYMQIFADHYPAVKDRIIVHDA